MKPAVFSGPTLWNDPILRSRNLCWLAPAGDGDVYRIARRGPPAIGLIDGVFEGAPSVWHKEILWAMSKGIHVFGAASMGALRAAELASFGMRGIGRIYQDFASGKLTDDDEVAVLHAGPELGNRPLSDSMVDIRATIAKAEASGVVSRATAHHLVSRAKAMFFKDRTWSRLLRESATAPSRKREIGALVRWLPAHRCDLKREDARAMVSAIRELTESAAPPFEPAFRFERTYYWRALVAANRRPAVAG